LGGFQFCGLEAAIGEEFFFGSRRDVPVNLTRIKEFKPHFKSDSGSSSETADQRNHRR
jgi:hypothetical protein